jgi:hypothetical protein
MISDLGCANLSAEHAISRITKQPDEVSEIGRYSTKRIPYKREQKPSQVIYSENLSALKGILALAVHIPCQIPLLRRWAKDHPHLWLMGSTTPTLLPYMRWSLTLQVVSFSILKFDPIPL